MSESTGGRPAQDAILTLDMAKEICMLQRNEKGKLARQYFLQLERDWNSPEKVMARALRLANRTIEEQTKQISDLREENQAMLPKALFADAVRDSKTDITVEKFAKLLYEKSGLRIGRNNLYSLLRAMGYLRENNLPYQKYMESEYFTTCEVVRNGKPYIVTLITGKGQLKLFDKISGFA